MSSHEPQRAPAAQRRIRRLPCAWHKVLLLSVLFILMSLCHGLIAPAEAAAPVNGAAVVVVEDEAPSPFRDCAASKRMVALSERRGAAATLDLPAATSAFTAHIPEAARGLRAQPLPLPENHRAFLQVFRI